MGKFTESAKRVFLKSTHKNLGEAIAADVVDVIPIVGDVGNAFRVYNAVKRGESDAFFLQSGDMLIGIIPIIGDIGDLLTPTNTLIFILRKEKFKNKIKKIKA